jgi:hypothetical protein
MCITVNKHMKQKTKSSIATHSTDGKDTELHLSQKLTQIGSLT